MLLEIVDGKVTCPEMGKMYSYEACCPPSDDSEEADSEEYDGYYDCIYFDGFTANSTKLSCGWPESEAGEKGEAR